MDDLIKRAEDAARDSRNLDGEAVVIGELIVEIERLAALEIVLKELEPYTDSIICYASTCSEHDGNRVAKLVKTALQKGTSK